MIKQLRSFALAGAVLTGTFLSGPSLAWGASPPMRSFGARLVVVNPFQRSSVVSFNNGRVASFNPLINPGAMVVTDQLIGDRSGDAAITDLLALLRAQARDEQVTVDEEVAASEAATGARNRALAWFMKSFGTLGDLLKNVKVNK